MGLAPPAFVDETGQPLPAHIQSALLALLPRLRRDFPTLLDDAIIADVMETAGRKIADAERRLGPLNDGLHGYAWAAVRSVAVSRVRRVREGLGRATLELSDNIAIAGGSPLSFGTPVAIEREILLREIFAMLTPEERRVAVLKKAGYSSEEIAQWRDQRQIEVMKEAGCSEEEIARRRPSSASAVDMMYSRVRAKIRAELERSEAQQHQPRRGPKAIGTGGREK